MTEYSHNLRFPAGKCAEGMYISVDADVSKNDNFYVRPVLPLIIRNREGSKSTLNPFSMDFNKRRQNFSMSKVKNAINFASKGTNITSMDCRTSKKYSKEILMRHNYNKSMSQYISKPTPVSICGISPHSNLPP